MSAFTWCLSGAFLVDIAYRSIKILNGLGQDITAVLGPVGSTGKFIDESSRKVVICTCSVKITKYRLRLTEWLVEPQMIPHSRPIGREVEHNRPLRPIRAISRIRPHLAEEIIIRSSELDVDTTAIS